MKKILKIVFIIIIVIIIAIAALSTSIFLKYRSIERQNALPELVATEITPKDTVALGDTILLKYQIKCPWNKRPLESSVTIGKGAQTISGQEFTKVKTGWGYIVWDAVYKIQPYLIGNIPEGKINVIFSPGIDKESNQLTVKIPSFSSIEIPNTKNKLSIAGKINPEIKEPLSSSKIYWIIALCILLGLVLFLWFFFKKSNKKIKPLTPWALALLNLYDLNDNFTSGKFNTVKCISSLTDIVRNYLEARFDIHAPRQTTEEFLNNMESWSSPLNNKDRNFLREFMTSADMIKFAQYEAPKAQIETAITRAKQLVDETTPDAEELKSKEKVVK